MRFGVCSGCDFSSRHERLGWQWRWVGCSAILHGVGILGWESGWWAAWFTALSRTARSECPDLPARLRPRPLAGVVDHAADRLPTMPVGRGILSRPAKVIGSGSRRIVLSCLSDIPMIISLGGILPVGRFMSDPPPSTEREKGGKRAPANLAENILWPLTPPVRFLHASPARTSSHSRRPDDLTGWRAICSRELKAFRCSPRPGWFFRKSVSESGMIPVPGYALDETDPQKCLPDRKRCASHLRLRHWPPEECGALL